LQAPVLVLERCWVDKWKAEVVAGDEHEHAQDDTSQRRRHRHEAPDKPPAPQQGPSEQELVRQRATEAVANVSDRLSAVE
jgi:hypothetical protein